VVGPGLLAGLSDDDPAGITTYSILGAEYGYQLIWVLVVSTAALIVFHELGVRLGIVSGKGLLTLVRERYGPNAAGLVLGALVIANTGTLCAEFAGVAAAMDLLGGMSRYLSVPLAAAGVSALVLRENFRHVEHFLLALSSVFIAYVISGFLAHPDWGAAAEGAAVPTIPLNRDALLVAVATVGTTLAPWGLAFIQSYAVDKGLTVKDLRFERADVIVGAVLTGVIGLFVIVACAATLHAQGNRGERRTRCRQRAGAARRQRTAPPRPSSASASSAPLCWRRRSSPSPPPTRSPRPSAAKPTSTTASPRPDPSTSASAPWSWSPRSLSSSRARR
jgi:NRAMP (natural resistance-associated macrophage protein)-like metal ion transporter